MNKIIKATAKHNCIIHYQSIDSKMPFGVSDDKRGISKGQVLELEIVSSEKIIDSTIASILGDRNVILKKENKYVFTYSSDFNYSN